MELIIVESGTKAKKIASFLGPGWIVEACNGHVQDLPSRGGDKDSRRAMWAATGDDLPTPPWRWTERAEKVMKGIISKAKKNGVEKIHIATDPDREGEFIAWRLIEILSDFDYVDRISFNEITETAVRASLATPRGVDMALVDAAKVRRYMDRLVGFRCSKFSRAWRLQSMGRVQTPTLGFIVDRELEREAFVPQPFYAVHCKADEIDLRVRFHEKDDPSAWFDRDKSPAKHHADRTDDGELARAAHAALEEHRSVELSQVEEGQRTLRPDPPFSTPSLLRVAGSHPRLGWSAKRVMSVASDLYQAGHITYMRTDSTRTNPAARQAMRKLISARWGESFLGKGVVGSDVKGDAKNVQDAHEAIRPTDPASEKPDGLSAPQLALYRLVWARFAASQMSVSRYQNLSLTGSVEGFDRPLTGSVSWRVHDGWEAAYGDFRKTPRLTAPTPLPQVGSILMLDDDPRLIEDETKPPSRFRQHTLVERMQGEGIGRPSTYATTIGRLLERQYITEEKRALMPTESGRLLWIDIAPMYGNGDSDVSGIFTASFTSDMESDLDRIETGSVKAPKVWNDFVDEFKGLHERALETRRARPTPRQRSFLASLLDNVDDTVKDQVMADRSIDDLTGEEAKAAIESLTEMDAHPAASQKQLKFIANLADRADLGEVDACALVGLEVWTDLTGGRNGTASRLIEELRQRDVSAESPATTKQREYAMALMKKAELAEHDVCAEAGAESFEKMTKSQASVIIEGLRKRLGLKDRGRRRRSS